MATIKTTFANSATATITLASLANGAGRCSTAIDNTSVNAISADIFVKIKTAGTMAAPNNFSVYLVRSEDGTTYDDAFSGSDAAFSPINASLLGILYTPTTATTYQGVFNTSILGDLPRKFAIAVVNNSGATADTTAGNFAVTYTLHTYNIA